MLFIVGESSENRVNRERGNSKRRLTHNGNLLNRARDHQKVLCFLAHGARILDDTCYGIGSTRIDKE